MGLTPPTPPTLLTKIGRLSGGRTVDDEDDDDGTVDDDDVDDGTVDDEDDDDGTVDDDDVDNGTVDDDDVDDGTVDDDDVDDGCRYSGKIRKLEKQQQDEHFFFAQSLFL